MLWDPSSTRITDFDSRDDTPTEQYDPVIVPSSPNSLLGDAHSDLTEDEQTEVAKTDSDLVENEPADRDETQLAASPASDAVIGEGISATEEDIESRPDDSSVVPTASKEQKPPRFVQQAFATTICLSGAIGWSLAIGVCVITIVSRCFELAGFPFNDFLPTTLSVACLFIAITLFIVPTGLRSLGIRIKNRMPEKLAHRSRMNSVADHLKFSRIALAVAVALPLLVILADQLLSGLDDSFSRPIDWLRTLSIAVACFLAAGVIRWRGLSFYRQSHAASLIQSLRAHHRGVALRSFIAQWDNPAREIYRSCRLSNRLAVVHRTLFVTVLGLLSASACLAALVSTRYYVGEALCGIAILAIAVQWPTSHRLVVWSGKMIDPFCEDEEEYEEFG